MHESSKPRKICHVYQIFIIFTIILLTIFVEIEPGNNGKKKFSGTSADV